MRGEAVLQLTAPFHFHHEIEALLRGEEEELARIELRRFGEAVGNNQRLRVAHLRAQAVLERWDGRTGAAVENLREAEKLAGEIGLSGELWQIWAKLGELQEELGEAWEASEAFGMAAGTIWDLADRIGDKELRAGFLAAPQARWVLEKAPHAAAGGQKGAEGESDRDTRGWSQALRQAGPLL